MSKVRPLLLALDTAIACSSVALTYGDVHDGELIASLNLNSKLTHSRRLLTGIDWLLSENRIDFADIDGLAVGLGPGSFTGLRIGMATVKGLATAMDKPLLGVSTLDALALCCPGDKPLCVLLDARKKEVYRRWYLPDAKGVYRRQGNIQALSPDELASEVSEPVLMVGDGLFPYGEIFDKIPGNFVTTAPLPLNYPSAVAIGFLCCEQLHMGDIMDLESAVPMYVRASDAELSLVKKEQQEQDR
ncbi:MAG TPA: tRNA (adenosine(37)-N6)-threonylcarbamoyltransferase complex dimerization subunit type 1 TsaB [Desulfocapsa sulfexigens]|nr:tRNA (adenosine(37)-N6)-threonylcarbamoyltransferase complex dimerization subunit type 1 TsaB [Desulfocapsa sulfexigens]